jgi:hypothetical protein
LTFHIHALAITLRLARRFVPDTFHSRRVGNESLALILMQQLYHDINFTETITHDPLPESKNPRYSIHNQWILLAINIKIGISWRSASNPNQ